MGGSTPLAVGRLVQPATDAGVLVQLVVALGVVLVLLHLLRARPEWRLVVIGLGLLLLGLFGLRAAH
jgi:hypothetical protein